MQMEDSRRCWTAGERAAVRPAAGSCALLIWLLLTCKCWSLTCSCKADANVGVEA